MEVFCNPIISIIIPIYNGDKYLRKTFDSIVAQDFGEYEVICVNDCSNDDSLAIINEYVGRDQRFRLFSSKTNLGIVPKVINSIISYAQGQYYFYSSQDDIFSVDLLGSMYTKALETGADAVIPDLVFYYENQPHKNKLLSGLRGDKKIVLTNREAFYYSLDWLIPGNALWKIDLLKKIGYYDFSMNADEYTTRVWFLNCNKIVFSCGTFFYRQDNIDAITKKLSIKKFDIPYTDYMLWKLARDNQFSYEVQEKLIINSWRGLIHYNSLSYFSEFSSARKKINDLYLICTSVETNLFITKSIRKASFFNVRLAMRSFYYFKAISILKAVKRVIKSALRSTRNL